MNDYTIVEKYQQNKSRTIAVRPFFDPNKQNMGLENYGMSLYDGVWHEESLACLELNGDKIDVSGLPKGLYIINIKVSSQSKLFKFLVY